MENIALDSYKLAMENSDFGLFDWNIKTGKVLYSEKWCEILGYNSNEIENNFSTWEKLVHPDDLKIITKKVEALLKDETPQYDVEFRMLCKNGRYKWINARSRVVERDFQNNPIRVIGTHNDIDDKKQMEQEWIEVNKILNMQKNLIEREQLFYEMAINSPGITYQFFAKNDGTKGFNYISPNIGDIFGFSTDQTANDWNLGEMIHPEDKERFFTSIDLAIKKFKEFNFEGRIVGEKGIKWVQIISRPMLKKDEILFNGIILDITERKKIEEELKSSRENETNISSELEKQNSIFKTLLKNMPIGIFMVEAPTGKPLIANEVAQQLLGRGILPDVTDENISEVYAAYKLSDRTIYPTEELPIIAGMYGKSLHIEDMLVIRPDGSESLFEVFGTPVMNKGNQIIASLVSFQDITKRKQDELELRDSEQRFKALHEASFGGIAIHDEGIILECNKGLSEMTGYTYDELIGINGYFLYQKKQEKW